MADGAVSGSVHPAGAAAAPAVHFVGDRRPPDIEFQGLGKQFFPADDGGNQFAGDGIEAIGESFAGNGERILVPGEPGLAAGASDRGRDIPVRQFELVPGDFMSLGRPNLVFRQDGSDVQAVFLSGHRLRMRDGDADDFPLTGSDIERQHSRCNHLVIGCQRPGRFVNGGVQERAPVPDLDRPLLRIQ